MRFWCPSAHLGAGTPGFEPRGGRAVSESGAVRRLAGAFLTEIPVRLVDMHYMIDFNTPLAGLERASASVNQTAAKIARGGFDAPGDSVDLSTEMVSLMQAQNDFKANTKVIQTEDDMNKSLLNITG
jgi:hypothetical protein